jgi:hypothetical protein
VGVLSEQHVALQIPPGEQWLIFLEGIPSPLPLSGNIVWKQNGSADDQAKWLVEKDEDGKTTIASNVSITRWNPYYLVSFYHELLKREKSDDRISLRVKASSPCRIEITNSESGQLLAIDADGNGSFTGSSDHVIENQDQDEYPDMAWDSMGRAGIEIYVYPTQKQPDLDNLLLTLELRENGEWVPTVVNELILPKK